MYVVLYTVLYSRVLIGKEGSVLLVACVVQYASKQFFAALLMDQSSSTLFRFVSSGEVSIIDKLAAAHSDAFLAGTEGAGSSHSSLTYCAMSQRSRGPAPRAALGRKALTQ